VNTVDKKGDTPLHHAAFRGHDDILQLLLNHGASVNAVDNNGYTPLHFAASWGHVKCIKVCFSQLILANLGRNRQRDNVAENSVFSRTVERCVCVCGGGGGGVFGGGPFFHL
jgi:ankyrin repeat protein